MHVGLGGIEKDTLNNHNSFVNTDQSELARRLVGSGCGSGHGIMLTDLPFTVYRLPFTVYQSQITNHQLPITYHQSPITNYQLPTTNCQLPITRPAQQEEQSPSAR